MLAVLLFIQDEIFEPPPAPRTHNNNAICWGCFREGEMKFDNLIDFERLFAFTSLHLAYVGMRSLKDVCHEANQNGRSRDDPLHYRSARWSTS